MPWPDHFGWISNELKAICWRPCLGHLEGMSFVSRCGPTVWLVSEPMPTFSMLPSSKRYVTFCCPVQNNNVNARKTWWKLYWNVAFGTKIEYCNWHHSSLWWVFDCPIQGVQAGALGRGSRDVGMSRHDINDRWMAKNEYRDSNAGLTRSIKYQETLNQYL